MSASTDVKLKHEDSKGTISVSKDTLEVYKSQGWYEPGDKPEPQPPTV